MKSDENNEKAFCGSVLEQIAEQPECAKKFFDENMPPECACDPALFEEYLGSLCEGDLRPILLDNFTQKSEE